MKSPASRLLWCLGLAALAFTLTACQNGRIQGYQSASATHLSIKCHPEDQVVGISNSVSFSVTADIKPPFAVEPLRYQWQSNTVQLVLDSVDLNWSDIVAATNQTFSISSAQLADVGFYRVKVMISSNSVTSDPAALQVTVPGSIIVYGTPTVSTGSSGASCPGPYGGYIRWLGSYAPVGIVWHGGSDNSGVSSAKVEMGGSSGDRYCAGGSAGTSSPGSPIYRFATYFGGSVPSGRISITLSGF